MKTLLIALSLMVTMVACNKDPQTKYEKQKQEANKEYGKDMNEVRAEGSKAVEGRQEKLNDARHELREEQEEVRD